MTSRETGPRRPLGPSLGAVDHSGALGLTPGGGSASTGPLRRLTLEGGRLGRALAGIPPLEAGAWGLAGAGRWRLGLGASGVRWLALGWIRWAPLRPSRPAGSGRAWGPQGLEAPGAAVLGAAAPRVARQGQVPLRRISKRGGSGALAPLVLVLVGLAPVAVALAGPGLPAARAVETTTLLRLLERKACPGCRLQDADLVLADLRDADLRKAQLQRANLSQAQLDGARLMGADLSFTSLQGASLRGADLRGAKLEGTDLRQSDLSGALLDPGAIGRAHWSQAQGLGPGALSYSQLHNAGVEAFQAGNWPEAERFFGEALRLQPQAKITWVARAISRGQQNKGPEASADFGYAATLYDQDGDSANAKELRQAAKDVSQPKNQPKGGNGIGSQILSGLSSLLPLAVQLLPKPF